MAAGCSAGGHVYTRRNMQSENIAGHPDSSHTPRIYVASLADYNAGRLHGTWIDADQSAEHICNIIHDMLAKSLEPIAEEWAIHDYECFGGLYLSEFENIDHVAAVARGIVERGNVFAALVAHFGGVQKVAEAQRYIDEGYRGAFERLADYAQEIVEDCYSDAFKALPDFIRYRIDFEGIADDMEMSGDIFTVECDGEIHVFDSHI